MKNTMQKILKSLSLSASLAVILAASPQAHAKTYQNCGVDESGDECLIDLISDCLDRTACSASFGHHGVYSVSHGGVGPIREDQGVAGDVAHQKDQLGFNNQVCSDLDITRVYYQPTKENVRWSTVRMEGDTAVIGGPVTAGDDVPTMFPNQPNQKLKAKCVRIDADASEPEYTILSVRVAVNLDENRSKDMHKMLVNASLSLAKSLEVVNKKVSKLRDRYSDAAKNPELSKMVPTMDAFLRSVHQAQESFHASKFLGFELSASRTPVNDPFIIRRMRTVYAFGKYLISQLQKSPVSTGGLISMVGNLCAEINHGFGINDWDQQEATGSIVDDSPQTADLTKFTVELPHVYDAAKPLGGIRRYGSFITTYISSLGTLETALKGMGNPDKDGLFLLTDDVQESAWSAYFNCTNVVATIPVRNEDGARTGLATFVTTVKNFCETIRTTFKVPVEDSSVDAAQRLLSMGSDARDSHRKLEPLFDVLALGVETAITFPGAKWPWKDPRYVASEDIENFLNFLQPKAEKETDSAVLDQMGPFLNRWNSPEFQGFLQQILTSSQSNDQASDAQQFISEASVAINRVVQETKNEQSGLNLPPGFGGTSGSEVSQAR